MITVGLPLGCRPCRRWRPRASRALTACFERYGVPTALLLDHGTPWWGPANPSGLTTVSVFLLNQGIELLHRGVRHPQTQGKVERVHRTLGERLRWHGLPRDLPGFAEVFVWFCEEYNHVRPHDALDLAPPATSYRPSTRPYQPDPPAWEYEPGSDVRRVDANGMVSSGGRRLFVSEALVGQAVGCRRFHQRVLVTYRHMVVRELHLRSGRSLSLLHPVKACWAVEAAPALPTAPTGPQDVSPMS